MPHSLIVSSAEHFASFCSINLQYVESSWKWLWQSCFIFITHQLYFEGHNCRYRSIFQTDHSSESRASFTQLQLTRAISIPVHQCDTTFNRVQLRYFVGPHEHSISFAATFSMVKCSQFVALDDRSWNCSQSMAAFHQPSSRYQRPRLHIRPASCCWNSNTWRCGTKNISAAVMLMHGMPSGH